MKKLFIGHFGGKDLDDWFFSWAESEKEALKTIEKTFGIPKFIKEITNISPGGFCFNPLDISTDGNSYYLLEVLQDDFKFENDDFIQEIIRNQKNKKNIDEITREEYRKLIELENSNQKKIEEIEYKKIIKQIDKINI